MARPVSTVLLWTLATVAAGLQNDLTLLKQTALQADTHHVQGIDFDRDRLWVTSVDKNGRKGYLQEFDMAGRHLRTVELTEADRFHPGGFSLSGKSLWIPVAEYRRESSAVIQKRSALTLELEFESTVGDHIGCLAVGPGELIGANWDSRDFYIWDSKGKLLRKAANPTGNAYQDIKFVDGKLVGGGLLPDKSGAIDWLEYPSLRLLRRIALGQTDRGASYASEGMALRGDRLLLLPEDSPSRLFEFRVPGRPVRP